MHVLETSCVSTPTSTSTAGVSLGKLEIENTSTPANIITSDTSDT